MVDQAAINDSWMCPRTDPQRSLQNYCAFFLASLLVLVVPNPKEFGGIDGLSAKFIPDKD